MSRLGNNIEFVAEGITTEQVYLQMAGAVRSLNSYIVNSMDDIVQHIAGRAHLNAPIKTGLLRSRIRASFPQATVEGWTASVYVANVHYSEVMHQDLLPYGFGAVYRNLGPRSRIQPQTVEGGVGGLYISRIAEYHHAQYFSRFEIGLDVLFNTGQNPGRLSFQPGYFRVNN